MPDLGRFSLPNLLGRYSLPAVLGRMFHHEGDTHMQPSTTGLQGGGYSYQPNFGGLNAPDLNFNGYTGGDQYTPSMTTLNPSPGVQPIDAPLYAPDLNIKTGNGGGSLGGMSGGHSTNGGGGMYTSGTLGGGSVVDPSQWGAYGIGGDSGPANGGIGQGYQLQMMSGGAHEGSGVGGGAFASFLAGNRPGPATGGGLPAMQQSNTGMPPNVLTGGGYPAQMAPRVGTGGALPAQQQRPQNRLGGGYNFGMGGLLR
jgi:hypothetical protein